MHIMISEEYIEKVGCMLNDKSYPLKQRFRALFTLKNLGGNAAIDQIAAGFDDKSALLKHELAYCLGQMKEPYAISKLVEILQNESQEVVVRHEAGEALGAIGNQVYLDVLKKYQCSKIAEIAETCELAITRLQYLDSGGKEPGNIYGTVDPTPPSDEKDIGKLRSIFLDENLSVSERYAALFALRDLNCEDSVMLITKGLTCGSTLFKHEVAFVLGQLQSPLTVPALIAVVKNQEENEIVRHEAIEALGAIGSNECIEVIKEYLNDPKDIVRESCEVALDMCDYENTLEFQYANGLEIISQQH